jgi:YidC/Oxa1 family membrane protein insertase
MQQKNLLLAFILSALIMVGWVALSHYIWPPPPPKQSKAEIAKIDDKNKPKGEEAKKPGGKEKANDKKNAEKKTDEKKNEKLSDRVAAADLRQLPATDGQKLVRLGAKQRDSRFHLFVELDPRGAAVRRLLLNKYQSADQYGLPEWEDDNKKVPKPLELIPATFKFHTLSFQTFAFDVNDPSDDQPLDTLGRIDWTVSERTSDEVDGRRRESVSFQAETQGVIVTKTYTLAEGEYHLGLEVKMRRKEGVDKNIAFRYQQTGAHGLPVEGKWYTSTFRNAMIGVVDRNGVTRDLQDLRQISNWGGGNPVVRDPNSAILYACVANQFFASAIVVDNQQKNRDFLRQARPTLETALTKGTVTSVAEDGSSFVLKPSGNETERTFYMPPRMHVEVLTKGMRIAVLHHTASAPERTGEYPEIVNLVFPREEEAPPALWEDDITVRVSTEPVELKGDVKEVVHKYLLYNGPVKVSQLFPPPGLPSKPLEEGGVVPELLERYHDELHLNTLTDYHSPGAMGTFASKIYWTDLVIKCTNVMHAVLGYIHALIPSYGLCIIVLTVLVRGMMFPLSRKQALMSVRMQQLAPELKKLQEKYKDDRQALGMAQMDLYRKHGVNPFGSCWVLLLQMPIFMGLYFALQESTHFRLAEFWPTWIPNLAAPDMLFNWSERIPFISRIEDYGSIFYLGPYFNLLPVIAVVLMIAQQKMITPPPADEQQAMQQKMMKYMMIFFGLMFYKVAAGLCLYFIASSAWGFCERKLLPKKKLDAGELATPPGESYLQKLLRKAQGEQVTPAPAGITTRNGGFTVATETRGRAEGKRRRDKRRRTSARGGEPETDDGSMLGRWRKRLHDWWVAVLKEAEKKHRS